MAQFFAMWCGVLALAYAAAEFTVWMGWYP